MNSIPAEKLPKPLVLPFDATPVTSEVSAVKNTIDEYGTALGSGLMDPAEKYDEFLEKLDSAGINAIIEEAQRQLDEWLAAK